MESISRRQFLWLAAANSAGLVSTGTLTGCATAGPTGQYQVPQTGGEHEIELPAPSLEGNTSLEETIANRRSVREFVDEPLSWEEISQLLWAAQGITDPRGLRSAPSAGALYPLEVYMTTAQGAYRYRPHGHSLQVLSGHDPRHDVWEAGLRQDAVRTAPVILIIAAVYQRTEAKYGDRAERYVRLEAGHAAHGILLQAGAMELGAVPIGAFHDDRVQAALGLPLDHQPLYLIPVGHPRD